MKAYKVVKNENGRLVSATNETDLIQFNGIEVTYIPKRYVYPVLKSSYLFCFTDITKAVEFAEQRSFKNYPSVYEVWECDIKQTTTRGIFSYASIIKEAWKAISNLIKNHKTTERAVNSFGNYSAKKTFAHSTVWAKRVKLLYKMGEY